MLVPQVNAVTLVPWFLLLADELVSKEFHFCSNIIFVMRPLETKEMMKGKRGSQTNDPIANEKYNHVS